MAELRIRLFGGAELCGTTGHPSTFPTRRARSIFCFLALNQGRLFERDVLCGRFWPERGDRAARKGLRTALWRIRGVLDEAGGDPDRILHADGGRIGIPEEARVWVDAREFERRVQILRNPVGKPGVAALDDLARAVELYRGDLVEGIYDDWCTLERERLRLLFLAALERLMVHHMKRGEWRAAIGRGCELLRHDPLRESIHRSIMECHYAAGDRPSAIRQFERCADILREELDIEPMAETLALRREILRDRPSRSEAGESRRWMLLPDPGARDPSRSGFGPYRGLR